MSKSSLDTVCSYCKLEFRQTSVRKFIRHMRNIHADVLASQSAYENGQISRNSGPEKVLTCGNCHAIFGKDVAQFSRHLRLHATGQLQSQKRHVEHTSQRSKDLDKGFCHQPVDAISDKQSTSDETLESEEAPCSDDSNCPGNEAVANAQQEASTLFLLKLYSKGNTTQTQIQCTVDLSSAWLEASTSVIQNQISSLVATLPDDMQSQPEIRKHIDNLKSAVAFASCPFQGLQTENMRIAQFKKQGLITPMSYEVGRRTEKQKDGTLKQVAAVAQYISLLDIMRKYQSGQFKRSVPELDQEVIKDYRDGQYYSSSSYFQKYPEAFCLVLYNDDIELANPLGSRAGVHKLAMFYISVVGADSSTLARIHPVVIAYAADVKSYGYDSLLKPLLEDLKLLNDGVKISSSGTSQTLKARLVQLAGDNLAANQTLGLVESFRADYFCRFCMMKKDETMKAVRVDYDRIRTKDLHQVHVNMLQTDREAFKKTGVKCAFTLDTLPYFSSIESTVPDCMHDILEGLGKRELKLILRSLSEKRQVCLEDFNDRLISFDYGRLDASNKPSVLLSFDSMKQTTSQMWCLLRSLPLLIGHLVPEDSPEWRVFLLLRSVMDLVFSPVLTRQATFALEAMIAEHHTTYLEVFPEETLIPKHHFLLHYGQSIRRHGTLYSCWCMRYEGKHRLAKLVASVSCNFRNMPLTVATRYQLQSFANERLSHTLNDTNPREHLVNDAVVLKRVRDEPIFGIITDISDNAVTAEILDTII